jgi:hypothetical protein
MTVYETWAVEPVVTYIYKEAIYILVKASRATLKETSEGSN